MDDFERAILFTFDPTADQTIKASAIAYCEQIKLNPDVWKLCIERFATSQKDEVKFWCLSTLNEFVTKRFLQLPETDRTQFKQGLMAWMRSCVTPAVPIYLRNKFAHLLVLVAKIDYPDRWPSFFLDLFGLLSISTDVIDLFLRILNAIDEEVVCADIQRTPEEMARNMAIKDAMRLGAMTNIVDVWYGVLSTYHETQPALAKACLKCLKNYVDWIDIGFVTSERFVQILFFFLSKKQLQKEACDVLNQIISKKMDQSNKLSLINSLRIIPCLTSIPAAGLTSEDDEGSEEGSFGLKVADLASGVGLQLLDAWSKVPTASAMVEELLPFLLSLFNSEDIYISSAALEFVRAYVDKLKPNISMLSPTQREHLGQILNIVANRSKYPADYDFDNKDEYEGEFEEYRKELFVVFKNIARAMPDACKASVQSVVSTTLSNLQSAGFADVEAALTLFYQLGEGITEDALKKSEDVFSQMFGFILSSSVSSYPHYSVSLMYFENVVRYARFLLHQQQFVPNVLISFLDNRGLRHPNSTVRSRVCYLFTRLVKVLRSQLIPFTQDIFSSMKEFLAVTLPGQATSPTEVSFDDKLFLYEALGIILGDQNLPLSRKLELMQEVLTPLLSQMEEIVDKELFRSDTPARPAFATLLCQQISAIGYLSKGFTGTNTKEAQETLPVVFKKILDTVLKVGYRTMHSDQVREKVFFFMHRMIEVLGLDIATYVPPLVSNFLPSANMQDLVELSRLANQVTMKFKSKAIPMTNEIFLPLASKILGILSQPDPSPIQIPTPTSGSASPLPSREGAASPALPAGGWSAPDHHHDGRLHGDAATAAAALGKSEVTRERDDLRRAFCQMLNALVSHECTSVLSTPANAVILNQVLGMLLTLITTLTDLQTVRLCTGVLEKLIAQWCGSVPGFDTFVLDQVVPAVLTCSFKHNFELDATASNLLGDIALLHRLILSKCGVAYLERLMTKELPALHTQAAEAQQFVQFLQAADEKAFKEFYKGFVKRRK